MGCGTSNTVTPYDSSKLVEENQTLIEEIEKFKSLAKENQDKFENLKKEVEQRKPIQKQNVEIKSVKLNSDQSKLEFNKYLKQMEERDKKLIDQLKDGRLFEDNNFEYFTQSVEKSIDNSPIKWLRPFEIVANPIIGLEYINPNEVKQGALGDCWFLAALGSIAKYPHLYSKIITENISLIGNNYNGYFKASFWQYGEWVSIYIDDKLPTKRGELIYGKCKTNNNFWVPLLEKCYAKLLGGYKNMIGGVEERALVDLTGLMFVSFKPNFLNTLPERLLLEDELNKNGQLIGCCAIRIQKDNAKSEDDYDGHAYSILSINMVHLKSKNKPERIYTIRNPHGYASETSRWSSDNPIWNEIDDISKKKCLYDDKDLLTWIGSNAIKSYFSSVTLGYYVPNLNINTNNAKIFEFRDNWSQKDIGFNMMSFLKKKHYLLNVKSNGKVFVLCNLLQENNGKELSGISVLLMPIRINKQNGNLKTIGSLDYNDLPDNFTNQISRQTSSYYYLSNGIYILIPMISDLKSMISLNYIFRVFSNQDIDMDETYYDNDSIKLVTKKENKFINIILRKCNFCEKPIDGTYTHSNNFVYHSECYEFLSLCDNCHKKFDGSYYTMHNNLKFCVTCFQYNQDRINSAKLK